MDTIEIAKKLKGLRAENGLSLIKASEKAKAHKETIRKYEKDAKKVPLGLFLDLLDSYGVDPVIFFSQLNAKTHEKEE